ncbi:MAG: DNA-3-methyladenine glycosylase family protein [Halobacteriota archaeon]
MPSSDLERALSYRALDQFEIVMPEPFDLSLTVAKPAGWHWSTPREIFKYGTLWSGTYLNNNPVGLKLSAVKNIVTATVYAQSRLTNDEETVLQAAIKLGLGEDEDLNAFYVFASTDEVLSITVQDLYGMRAGRLDDLFGRVILATTLQMAPLKRSQDMMARLLERYGTKIAFDGREVVLWPEPSSIAERDPIELRRKAKLGYRAERLVKAAHYLIEHPMSLKELHRQPETEAVKNVMEIPGIGTYSAGLIIGQGSVPLDVWSVVIMSELLLGREPKRPRQEIKAVTQAVNDRWGKWAWMAFVYVVNDLPKLAKIYNLSRLT